MRNKFSIFNFQFSILSFLIAYLLSLITAPAAHAQVPIGTGANAPFKTPFTDFGSLISVIIANAYVIAGIVLLFLIIFGGFGIISGAGGGDKQKIEQGKQAITSAFIGFLIIFVSYWIIQIVEVVTGLDILKPGF